MSKSTKQYAAHCAARGVREPGRVQGVTFRAARETSPVPRAMDEAEVRRAICFWKHEADVALRNIADLERMLAELSDQ